MKLPVAILLISLTLCCYSDGCHSHGFIGAALTSDKRGAESVTADTCPVLINILNKYFFGSRPEYMESIAPFATSDVMKTANYELKGCVLKLSQEYLEAAGEVMKNILAKCEEAP